jgi:Protein of unknown function DUF47
MLAEWPEEAGLARDVLACEQAGDRITHDVIHRLNQTFVTPIDREDIYELASAVHDIAASGSASWAREAFSPSPTGPTTPRRRWGDQPCADRQRQPEARRGASRVGGRGRATAIALGTYTGGSLCPR